ncbi:TetR/AcrR family transcriptional regulator [Saccharospirillum mangrovi]|uniref:TetR/AcrR family transcriptional regulator n=1 Tax=Saccharospirillum mangrovi TaxID=2161747 RepID=UPI000D3AAB80|nr:TetR/AcrR family transcriptional regulator [Saccharospirillum mangrovi]
MARQTKYDREDVLRRALELFWRKGYHATSLKDLELHLDMRPGSIYAAFGSKEALFIEVLRRYAENSQQQLNDILAQASTPLEGLAAYVRYLGKALAEPSPSRACMLVKTLLETPDGDPVLRQATEEFLRNTEVAFTKAFQAAQASGNIGAKADPDQLACRLQAEIFGLRAYAQRTDAVQKVAALADGIARDIEALDVRATAVNA